MMTNADEIDEEFISDLKDLLTLDYAAVEAYEAAIQRFKNQTYKNKFQEFEQDHNRHVKSNTQILKEMGEDYPTGPGMKKIITQGKVMLAEVSGDTGILKAIKSNEQETTESYKQINFYKNIPENISILLLKGYEDQQTHLDWIEKELSKIE